MKNDELLQILHHGIKPREKYPAEVRRFCLGLFSYSARAYEYVRKSFHNHLPGTSTIKLWFANSDIRGEEGIQDDQMERLRRIVEDFKIKYNRDLMCSLVFDEIHIRQQLCFSLQLMDYVGHVGYGQKPGEKNIASQAIVFLLVGLDVNFEFPVAYHFVNSLDAKKQSKLMETIIAAVTRCGVKITNITFDGNSANKPACHFLGANLNVNVKGQNKQLKPFILNPVNNTKIYIFFDPCHMEKLIRNRWASCKVFFNDKGNKIEWRYIEALYAYSRDNDFQVHKLTKKHVQWKNHAMRVGLAVETFSESVATAIEFLMRQNVPEFQGAQPTVDFLRRINTLFDIFNSRKLNELNIFKRPLSAENKRSFSISFKKPSHSSKSSNSSRFFTK